MTAPAAISVVVPTRNEATELADTLAALAVGATAGGAAEVVVSDSGSTDGTPDLARRLGIARVFLHDAWIWLRHLLRLSNEAQGKAYWATDRRG